MAEFSYSFQVTLKYIENNMSWGITLMNTQDPGKPIAADRNPYSNHVTKRKKLPQKFSADFGGSAVYTYSKSKLPVDMLGFSQPPVKTADSQTYVNLLRKGRNANSRNHKQEGQNVCYLDGHAKWANTPKAGVDEDSIWSNWTYKAPATGTNIDFEVCDNNTMPCDSEPMTDLNYGKMRPKSNWATDAVLIP
jgi:prepilin-type processing-associated H-X9-DG protein